MFKILVIIAAIANNYSLAQLSNDGNAQIQSLTNEQNPDGSFNYQFETTNGISAQEQGVGGQQVSGSSQYYSPDGQLISITYTADEYGYKPLGDHLPTPPPIPEAIQRSLEYIRSHPSQEEQERQHQYSYQQQQDNQNQYDQPQYYQHGQDYKNQEANRQQYVQHYQQHGNQAYHQRF